MTGCLNVYVVIFSCFLVLVFHACVRVCVHACVCMLFGFFVYMLKNQHVLRNETVGGVLNVQQGESIICIY